MGINAFKIKYTKLKENLPVFNEITDYADYVDDEIRAIYHKERAALLREWHGSEPDANVRKEAFTYTNGDYEGCGYVYIPAGLREDCPIVLYIHGGGWNSLCKECYEYECTAIARDGDCLVFSCDYRLAPEYKFPTYLEDCYCALLKAVSLGKQYGATQKKLVLMGDSAGGNIAAALCYMAKDRGGPEIDRQVLIYPVTGMYMAELARNDVPEFLNSKEEIAHPYVSVVRGNLKQLPPTLIIEGTCDFLIDDNLYFAEKLKENNVDVQLTLYSGMPHGFIQYVCDEAQEAIKEISSTIRNL